MTQTLACARCGAPLPAMAADAVTTCPFCGAAAAPPPKERIVVASDGGAGPRCPRCADALREATTGSASLRACRSCGGIWLDRATAERVARVRDPDLEELARRAVVVTIAPPPAARQAEIACPVCAQRMRRAAIPDTIHCVDVCGEHGTWFDREELATYARSLAEARVGEVDDDDKRAAGVPVAFDAGEGFFGDLFRSVRALF